MHCVLFSLVLVCLASQLLFLSLHSQSSSSGLPKMGKKPPKAPSHSMLGSARTLSQCSSASSSAPSFTSPTPSQTVSKAATPSRWLAVRLPPLKELFNGSMPMFNSARYQRHVLKPLVRHSADVSLDAVRQAQLNRKKKRIQLRTSEKFF